MNPVPSRFSTAREATGLTPAEMAEHLWMNLPSYYDLESQENEWLTAVEISQLVEFSKITNVPLLSLILDQSPFGLQPLSFVDLAKLITDQIRTGILKKTDLGWDVDKFLECPSIANEYPILFLQILDEKLHFDWRRPLLHAQNART